MAKIVAVKVENGSVRCYDLHGHYVTSISSRSTNSIASAVVNGEVITVTEKKGTVILYDANNGQWKRNL